MDSTKEQKYAERMARLRKLHQMRNEAKTQNHKEVVEEDSRKKLPSNWETRKKRADYIVAEEAAREVAASQNLDYDRLKLLEVTASDAERLEKKKRKTNMDRGFSNFETQTARQYNRLVKSLGPKHLEKYNKQRIEQENADFIEPYAATIQMRKDNPDAVENMAKDLDAQIEKRKKYSRRRTHNDDADVDFINERNSKFNRKLERYYGEHTAEIKQNLERGTAI